MGNWLTRWFGGKSGHQEHAARPVLVRPATKPAPSAAPASPDGALLGALQIEFLTGLLTAPEIKSLDDLPYDDRAFIAGIQKRFRTRELELPVLPEMFLRLSKMFRDGVAVGDFVSVINGDPSLAVEVLRTANSAFYASGRSITSLQDAIIRIGLDRLQSVLMVAHLRGRVLKAGPFQLEAEMLLELAMPVGNLASRVAKGRGQRETCFMRGALLHAEHFVILGATATIARDVKRNIIPSPQALHQAFTRFGRPIREAVATKWNLTDLLLGDEGETGVAEEYALIRSVLISRWLRLPLPAEASEFDASVLAALPARVPPPPEPASTDSPSALAS